MGGKMGHDLTIEVGTWSATATVGEDPSATRLEGSAEVGSMHVVSGEGGVKPLSEGDKADIKKTITDKILGSSTIDFRSTSVTGGCPEPPAHGGLPLTRQDTPTAG